MHIQPDDIIRFDGKVEIRLYGRGERGTNDWNIKVVSTDDVPEYRSFGDLHPSMKLLVQACVDANIKTVLSPSPHQPLLFISKDEWFPLTWRLPAPDGTSVVRLKHGAQLYGCEVPYFAADRTAVFLPSADSYTLIVRSRTSGRVIAARAGLDSLVDLKRLELSENFMGGMKSRTYESIVDAIVERFREHGDAAKHLAAFAVCGIRAFDFPHPFKHPEHGTLNRRLVEYVLKAYGDDCVRGIPQSGHLDLPEIMRAQLVAHGMPPSHFAHDNHNTYGDASRKNATQWWSLRRSRTAEEDLKRNGVLIYRLR